MTAIIDRWAQLQKRQASVEWQDGFVRAAQKFTREWANAAVVGEKTFDKLREGVQTLGKAAVDHIFDGAEFRADEFLKKLAKDLAYIAMDAAIGNLVHGIFSGFNLFADGGYTGDGPTGGAAGIVHGKEYVLNAAATRSIGVGALNVVNATGSLASLFTGRMSAVAPLTAGAGNVVNVTVENNNNSQIGVSRTMNGDGSFNVNILVDAVDGALADRAARGRSSFAKAMEGRAMRNGTMPGFRV